MSEDNITPANAPQDPCQEMQQNYQQPLNQEPQKTTVVTSEGGLEMNKKDAQKVPFWKKKWFKIAAIVLVLLFIIGSCSNKNEKPSATNQKESSTPAAATQPTRDKTASSDEVATLQANYDQYINADQNWLAGYTPESVAKLTTALDNAKKVLDNTSATSKEVNKASDDILTAAKNLKEPEPPAEYKAALRKAQTYSDRMYMSKQGIYEQLTSSYGEGFEAEAAQYAIDHVTADWNNNALQKAKTYRDRLSMSKNNIYEQLISEYGEKFTADEAQYAVDHLDD